MPGLSKINNDKHGTDEFLNGLSIILYRNAIYELPWQITKYNFHLLVEG
jgi:hypothetical protein